MNHQHEKQQDEETDVVVVTVDYTNNQGGIPNKDAKCIQVLPFVTEIPDLAFAGFSDLKEIRFKNHDPTSNHSNTNTDTDGDLGDDEDEEENNKPLQRIGNCAFMDCKSLSEIVIPSTVEWIGSCAFQGCSSLQWAQLPQDLTELGEGVFRSCSSLRIMRLPNSLSKVGQSAWCQCSQLKQVEFLSNTALEEIPFAAFQLCCLLESIVIPPSVKTIASHAFSDCYSLCQVQLSEGLRKIDANAFRQCKSLKKVKIPSTVLRIGRCAFAECSCLSTVEFANGNLQVLNYLAFAECKKLLHLALPTSIHTLYPNTFAGCTLLRALSRRSVVANQMMGASLRTRFVELPVHQLCYLQVHRPLAEFLEAIQSLEEDSLFAPSKHFDFLGMTPFHILSASSRPDFLLFDALMSKYPQHLWSHKDVSRTTAISYLLVNPAPESSSAIQHVVNSVLQDRMDGLGWHQWRVQIQDLIHVTCSAPVSERTQLFEEMIQRFSLLEQKEHLSNLELAVWKTTISKTTTTTNDSNGLLLRESCRISCGAEIVIPNVLSYMEEPTIDVFGL